MTSFKIKIAAAAISALIFSSMYGYGQTPNEELEKFNHAIQNEIYSLPFQDSTAIYTCNIQISVDKKRGYTPVIKYSNRHVERLILGIHGLYSYDYRKLMGGSDYVKFILPVSIVILDKAGQKQIPAYIIDQLSDLFYQPIEEEEHRKIVYLSPIIRTLDKKKDD